MFVSRLFRAVFAGCGLTDIRQRAIGEGIEGKFGGRPRCGKRWPEMGEAEQEKRHGAQGAQRSGPSRFGAARHRLCAHPDLLVR
ncbi:hypothetical protein BC374_05170 [Ensifer sp. LC13]|nr:hypothetical protein BC362_24145 [Ensifer sp. LC14]OCP05857.1 hypothetical protein BBX50_05110 [Ensifer sp. LC11]OCP06606.1 hypothetical protein BC374_05170 [Ensifer sp. LC13]OCP31154.1 hypothetical protein BC364_04925 [Ensifer sp. LC499]